ncbi:MAG: Wzz/FepE/Etk N-terminal domain-containing protein [Nitrospirales bacterium]
MSDSTFSMHESKEEKTSRPPSRAYIKDFLDVVCRRKWLILSFVVLGMLVGGWLAWINQDVYRSTTVIVVEQVQNQERSDPTVGGNALNDSVFARNRQVLSRTNLQRVIDQFHLSPDIVKRHGYESAIESLRKNINIDAKVHRGSIEALAISFSHHDPTMAMKVTATLAAQYIHENIGQPDLTLEAANEFVDQELVLAKKALEEKATELSEYNRRFLRELPEQLEGNLRALDRLQLDQIRVQGALQSLYSRMVLAEKAISLNKPDSSDFQARTNRTGVNPSALELSQAKQTLERMTSESIEDEAGIIFLKRQIEKLEAAQLQQLSRDSDSPDANSDPYLVELRNEQHDLKIQMDQLESQLKKTTAAMAAVERRIQRTPEREQGLLVLERQYDLFKEHYQHLQQKRIDIRMSGDLETVQKSPEFRILDPANLPVQAEGMSRAFMAVGGLAGGAGMGLAMAVLLDFLFPTFRRSSDVAVLLGFPLLATIPRFQMAYGKPMTLLSVEELSPRVNGKANNPVAEDYVDIPGMAKGKSVFHGRSAPNRTFSPQFNLVSKWRPQSLVAEQFRVAATRLDLLGDRSMGNVVLVSSAMKGEGKTSTATNLAYTLARDLDEPILLIDCDFKCPNLHNVLAIDPYPGVADYLAGQVSLESCFQQYHDLSLWCLPVGDVETCPVFLSKLRYLSTLIESIRSRYRFIILDGPPIFPLADINVLSGLADIILMVVRSGVTPQDVVQKATEMLHTPSTMRIILTDAWPQGIPQYVGHRYSKSSALLRLG